MSFQTRQSRPVCIVGGLRTPFAKMGSQLANSTLLDLLSFIVEANVQKFNLKGQVLGEVALGTTFFHPSYWNLSRDTVFNTSLSPLTPALGLQRACATSLETTIAIANKIALGQIDSGIAGGVESMSNIALYAKPAFAQRLVKSSKAKNLGEKLRIWKGFKLKDILPTVAPGTEFSTGLSMGQHCELMAQEWKITRGEQDALALKSHQTGVAAYQEKFYDDLVAEFQGLKTDNFLRSDTTLDKLSKLKTAFEKGPAGTLTAGNSSPFTDGAAAILLSSEEWAKKRGLPILAYIRDFETTAIDIKNDGLLMAPAFALPKLLKRNNLKLQDFDTYEIHEAFAAQVLCTLKAWESAEFCKNRLGSPEPLGPIDRSKLNTVGGSVALGHPFGATGARLISTQAKVLKLRGSGRGLISVCTGGGMGTVMILERP